MNETYQELESRNPYLQLRIGQIIEVITTDVTDIQDEKAQKAFGKIRVKWIDWESREFPIEIPFAYPCYSNPIIKEDTTSKGKNSVGSSYGILFMPSVGDRVVVGFRADISPIILGFLPHNYYAQVSTDDSKSVNYGPFRNIKSGEFSIKGERQEEVFLTEKGSIRLIVKENPDDSETVPTTALAEIIIGKSYVDEDYSDTYKTAQAKDVVCHVKMESGAGIKIDSDGNIEIDAASGKEININGGDKGAARNNDAVRVTIPAGSFVTTVSGGSGAPAIGIKNLTPVNVDGTITEGSDTVKIG